MSDFERRPSTSAGESRKRQPSLTPPRQPSLYDQYRKGKYKPGWLSQKYWGTRKQTATYTFASPPPKAQPERCGLLLRRPAKRSARVSSRDLARVVCPCGPISCVGQIPLHQVKELRAKWGEFGKFEKGRQKKNSEFMVTQTKKVNGVFRFYAGVWPLCESGVRALYNCGKQRVQRWRSAARRGETYVDLRRDHKVYHATDACR